MSLSHVEPGKFTPRPFVAGEALQCSVTAALVAASLAWLGPQGSDMAAHAYQRGLFIEHGFTLWNNLWYSGHYSFVTYSVLYYPLAAALGIRVLAVATVAVTAFAFALVTWHEWGPTARWSSRTFAIVWAGIVLAGAYPFALGIALALLAIRALQERAPWQFALLVVLTLAASPLAFALLTLIAVGVALAKRVDARQHLVPAVALATTGTFGILLWRIFPDDGRYPFSIADLAAVLAFSVLGAALLWKVESARALRMIFAVYGCASIVAFLIHSALGSNITRLQFAAIPIAVLVVSLRAWRPFPLCMLIIALAVSWNLKPLARSVSQGLENPAEKPAYWQPAIEFLHTHLTPSYRVEAVDTVGHWPAEYLPAARIPLARGWYRQDDFPENAVLYGRLTPARYAAWLRGLGVRYVLLSHAEPDYSALGEAALLRSGRSGLRPVFTTRDLTIFEVPAPTGILSGGRGARLIALSQTRLVLKVVHPGRYRLAVRYTPYWRISRGCVAARADGMSDVFTPRPGTIVVAFHVQVGKAIAALVDEPTRTCAAVDADHSSTSPPSTAPARRIR